MGVYYNPVDDIIDGRVGTFINTHDYDEAMRKLPNGHHLYALCGGLFFNQAVYVGAKEEFDEFFGQYTQGFLISFQLVALPEDAHKRSIISSGL